MPDVYADVVATLAFLIAGVTAGRQIYLHVKWDRPVLAVTGDFGHITELHSDGTTSDPRWGFTLTATNTGETPTRLLDACWELALADGRTVLVRGTDSPGGIYSFATQGETLILDGEFDPKIPLTLGKLDAVEWEWERDERAHPLVADAVRGRPIVTYVSRTRRKDRNASGNPGTTLGAGEWRPMDPAGAKASSAGRASAAT